MRRTRAHVLVAVLGAMLQGACASHNPPEVARALLKIDLTSVEATDVRLASALITASIEPTPEHYRDVAREYRRLGLLDRAHDHLIEALRLRGSED